MKTPSATARHQSRVRESHVAVVMGGRGANALHSSGDVSATVLRWAYRPLLVAVLVAVRSGLMYKAPLMSSRALGSGLGRG